MVKPAMELTTLQHITPQEYLEAEILAAEKHEYFNGRVVQLAGSRLTHSGIVANLIGEIALFVKSTQCYVFPPDARIATPSCTSFMYPDVSIFCGKTEKLAIGLDTFTNPSVIIEVMGDNTRHNDRGHKFFYYKEIPAVKEYILVDSTTCFVECICKQQDGVWKFEQTTDIHSSIIIHTIKMPLALADIYDKVLLGQITNAVKLN